MSRIRLGVEREAKAFGRELVRAHNEKRTFKSNQRRKPNHPWGGGVRPRETYRGSRRNRQFGRLPIGNSTPLERLARKQLYGR